MAVEGWVLAVGGGIIGLILVAGLSNIAGFSDGLNAASKIHEDNFSKGWDAAAEYCKSKKGQIDWFEAGWEGMGKTVIQLMETAEGIQLEGSFGKYGYTPTARDWQAIKNGLRKAIEKEEGK